MKKQLDGSRVVNELRGASAFFRAAGGDEATSTGARRKKGPDERPNGSTERRKRTVDRTERAKSRVNDAAQTAQRPSGPPDGSVLDELDQPAAAQKRQTERLSFEIQIDMKSQIDDVQYRFKKKTVEPLSASRIIREALERYLAELSGRL